MAAFASRYGLLGFGGERIIRGRKGRPDRTAVAESTTRWRYEMAEMQRLLNGEKAAPIHHLCAAQPREKRALYFTRSQEGPGGRERIVSVQEMGAAGRAAT